jgi:uncharacterized delta-60 repeat protein
MPGQIDFAFGKDGVVQINVPGASGSRVVSVINGPDDTLYVCGTALLEGASKFFITELNSAGDVISGFGDNGYVIDMFDEKNEDAYASQLVLSGKKLLLVGSSYIGTDPFPALAKLDLQGNFDTTFGENGQGKVVIPLSGPLGTLTDPHRPDTFKPDAEGNAASAGGAINLLDDGKILLSHYFFRIGAPSYGVILRLLSNGSLDAELNNLGYFYVVAPGYENGQTQIRSVTVDHEGRYVACGGVHDLASSPLNAFFVRYSPDGKPDTTFGPGGFQIIRNNDGLPGGAHAEMLIALEKGSILSQGGSVYDPYVGQLLMLDENGQMNPDFNFGQPLNTQLGESSTLWKAFTRQIDGKLVVTGAIDKQMNSFVFDVVVARFDKTGKLDTEFNNGLGWTRTRLGSQTAGAVTVLLQEGKIVVGGVSDDVASGVVVRYHG